MAAEKQRPIRVGAGVREEIARQLSRELGDPRLVDIIIVRVVMTDDLRLAKVFYRILTAPTLGSALAAKKNEAQKGLEKAAGRLRKAITTQLALRYAPEMRFEYDEGQEARDRIDELLEQVKREPRADDAK